MHVSGFYFLVFTSQHALVVPSVVKHVLFHLSLPALEEKLNYRFSDRRLLEVSESVNEFGYVDMSGCVSVGVYVSVVWE